MDIVEGHHNYIMRTVLLPRVFSKAQDKFLLRETIKAYLIPNLLYVKHQGQTIWLVRTLKDTGNSPQMTC